MPFFVQMCSAPTGSQQVGRHTEPVVFCQSPANAIAPPVGKSPTHTTEPLHQQRRFSNRATLAENRRVSVSRKEVQQLQKSKTEAFVRQAQQECTMLGASRQSQYVAARIALEAVWHYRKEQRRKKAEQLQQVTERSAWAFWLKQRRATRDFRQKSSKRPEEAKLADAESPKLTAAEASRRAHEKAEDKLLRAILEDVPKLMFSPAWAANPNPVVMEHPYLYTMSEIQKQGLFTGR